MHLKMKCLSFFNPHQERASDNIHGQPCESFNLKENFLYLIYYPAVFVYSNTLVYFF